MSQPGTLGSLVGKLHVQRIERQECDRSGHHPIAKLIERLGPDYRLTDWLHELTRDCSRKNQAGVTRACGAVMPDLAKLR